MPVTFPPPDWDAAAIPATTAVLGNGLRVVAHRDSKTPIVAVLVAYHTGSRDEPPSKAGLAHLCEHLMFSGTRNFPENFFGPLEMVGATAINAITREDYTAYFETVPVAALDATLRLEADRMQDQAAALDQTGIDLQRSVVRNELLQRESADYGRAPRLLAQHGYPPEHPYRHPANGLVEDLENLTLADASDWFKKYHGPDNATLVIAGDVDPNEAIRRARRHFEAIPIVTPASHNFARPAIRKSERRASVTESAASRIYLAWNAPSFGAAEHAGLEMTNEILAGGIASRLFKRLVAELRLATEVSGELYARALGSQFVVWATASPGTTLSALEKALRRELDRFRAQGPTPDEVKVARVRRYCKLLRGFERVGGPRSKAETLAIDAIMTGDANAHRRRFARMASLEPREIREVARRWLGDDALVIEMNAANSLVERPRAVRGRNSLQKLVSPRPGTARAKVVLASPGLRIVAIARPGTQLFEFRIITGGGFARDPAEKSGVAGVAMAVFSLNRDSRFDARLERLGAAVETRVRADACVFAMSAPASTLAASLKIYRGLLMEQKINEALVERARESQMALIRREQTRPGDLALRVLPPLVFGAEHPYAIPMTGSGIESGVRQVSTDDVREYFARWRVTGTSTLIAVGPMSTDQMEARVGRTLADASSSKPRRSDHRAIPPGRPPAPRIVVIDQPDRSQSAIFAALAVEPLNSVQTDELVVADALLGGLFTSRLNSNLRERLGWTYGAQTRLSSTCGPRLLMANTFVPNAVTAAAMAEIAAEFKALAGSRPVARDELARTVNCLTRRAPATLETNAMIATAIEDDLVCGLPDDYSLKMAERLSNLNADQMAKACASAIAEKSLAWLVVGDAGSFMKDLETAGLGSVEVVGERKVRD